MAQSTTDLNLVQYLASAQQAAREARQILLDYFGHLSQVSEKHQAGLVSEADLTSERIIQEILTKNHPEIEFLGEEDSFKKQNLGLNDQSTTWVVDPLDGTTNYVHGFPIFCISIGLVMQGKQVLGLIDVPMLNKTYTAIDGQGAFVNGEPIKVSQRTQIKEALLATGFFAPKKDALKQQLNIFNKLIFEARGIRRAGAAAFDLCMVAEGVFDGFWEKNLSPWDTCAGAVLIREAGGIVTNYQGDDFKLQMNSILASNSHLHSTLLATTQIES